MLVICWLVSTLFGIILNQSSSVFACPHFTVLVSLLWWAPIARSYIYLPVCQDVARMHASKPLSHTHMRTRGKPRHLLMQSLMEWLAHSLWFGNTGLADFHCSSVCMHIRFKWLDCICLLFGPWTLNQWLWVHFRSSASIWLAVQVIRNSDESLKTGTLKWIKIFIHSTIPCYLKKQQGLSIFSEAA